MSHIEQHLQCLLERIERAALSANRRLEEITLIAVTKQEPLESLQTVYEAGCREFGESRVQEALLKQEKMPRDIRWHFIGRLQRNKVAKVIGRFSLIHSVDSVDLAEKISRLSVEWGCVTPILLETNTSKEVNKAGASPEQWRQDFESLLSLKGVVIQGLMTMAPFTQNEDQIRSCFAALRALREDLQMISSRDLPILSMGMSNDFTIAIQEGATHIRIGSALFRGSHATR